MGAVRSPRTWPRQAEPATLMRRPQPRRLWRWSRPLAVALTLVLLTATLVPRVLAEEGDGMLLPLGFDSAPEQEADQPTDLVAADTEGDGGEGEDRDREVTRSASLPQGPGGTDSSPPGPGTGGGAQAQLNGLIGDAATGAGAVFSGLGREGGDAPGTDELLNQVEGLLQGPLDDPAVVEEVGRLLHDAVRRGFSGEQRVRAVALQRTYVGARTRLRMGLDVPVDPRPPESPSTAQGQQFRSVQGEQALGPLPPSKVPPPSEVQAGAGFARVPQFVGTRVWSLR
jgi:hypothetical protein